MPGTFKLTPPDEAKKETKGKGRAQEVLDSPTPKLKEKSLSGDSGASASTMEAVKPDAKAGDASKAKDSQESEASTATPAEPEPTPEPESTTEDSLWGFPATKKSLKRRPER